MERVSRRRFDADTFWALTHPRHHRHFRYMHVTSRALRSLTILFAGACLACKEPPIEYRGSATSSTVSDSSAAMRLVFWTRTDTSLIGFIRVGWPINIQGSAYGWHERSALTISMVSSAGDTIMWTSQMSDDQIGGRYEVLGGPRQGQEGTWRAQLSTGPAASPATLRATAKESIVPRAFAVLLLALVIAAAGARWVLRQPAPPGPPTDEYIADQPVGIRGWLTLFIIGQSIAFVVHAVRFPEALEGISGVAWHLGPVASLMRPMLVFETAFHVLQLLAPVVGLYLIVRRNRYAPRFLFAYMSAAAVFVVVDMATLPLLSRQLAPFQEGVDPNAETNKASRENLRALIGSILWAGYWVKSRRVRVTFGSNALNRGDTRPVTDPDRSVTSQPASEAS